MGIGQFFDLHMRSATFAVSYMVINHFRSFICDDQSLFELHMQ